MIHRTGPRRGHHRRQRTDTGITERVQRLVVRVRPRLRRPSPGNAPVAALDRSSVLGCGWKYAYAETPPLTLAISGESSTYRRSEERTWWHAAANARYALMRSATVTGL